MRVTERVARWGRDCKGRSTNTSVEKTQAKGCQHVVEGAQVVDIQVDWFLTWAAHIDMFIFPCASRLMRISQFNSEVT